MRTLAIGDIHGYVVALDALLDRVRPGADDLLITLGDYVDRGPDSPSVIDRIIALRATVSMVCLRGNHDEMMLQARDDREARRLWLCIGGIETLLSYDHRPGDPEYDLIPEQHWQFLEHDCQEWYETDTHLFVHASLDPQLQMREQSSGVLLWEKLTGPLQHCSGKVVICGHTRQSSGLPLDLGCTVCIDTAIYEPGGWLTCLHVETGHYWQANARGELREGDLS